MASEVRILPSAEAEVENIVAYLSSFGSGAARRFVTEYRHQLDVLAEGAVEYGLSRMPELAALGYRACFVGSYILLYYREPGVAGAAVVAHVFHQRQDYARLVVEKG